MAKIIGLPKLSPTMEEGTLVRWVKTEGESIDIDDLLAEVETDKALMEFRSFDRGVLLKILVPEGEILKPDQPVAVIGQSGEDIQDILASLNTAPSTVRSPVVQVSEQTVSNDADSNIKTNQISTHFLSDSDQIRSSPLVRKMAKEHDLHLQNIQGTGPHGRIIKRDVDSFLSSQNQSARRVQRNVRIVAPSSTRKTIARRLTESKRDIPHYYLTIDTNVGRLIETRAAINDLIEKKEDKISINDLMVKAVALSLRAVPDVNVSWMEDGIHYSEAIDISIAVAIPDGLTTPVLRNADIKTITQIHHEIRLLAQKAKEKRLTLEEITGGTFSISNLGMYGIDQFAAVINPPEGAILAVGALRQEPVVENNAVVVGHRMSMTLSADHRVIDGAVGATFLSRLRKYIESPVTMFIDPSLR